MPAAEQLPDDLKDLAYRNGFELSHNRWESDVRELIKRLGLGTRSDLPTDEKTGSRKSAPQKANKSWFAIGGVFVAAIAIGAGLVYYKKITPEPNPGSMHLKKETTTSSSGRVIQKMRRLKKAKTFAKRAMRARSISLPRGAMR